LIAVRDESRTDYLPAGDCVSIFLRGKVRYANGQLNGQPAKPDLARPAGWSSERSAWLRGFRRLQVRFDRRDDVYLAWNSLAVSVVCWRILVEDLM
jgi:hypothetical protein